MPDPYLTLAIGSFIAGVLGVKFVEWIRADALTTANSKEKQMRLKPKKIRSVKADEDTIKVLKALDRSSKPLNVSKISKASNVSGPMVIFVLRSLHKHEMVQSSSGKMSRLKASADIDSYSITDNGRELVAKEEGKT